MRDLKFKIQAPKKGDEVAKLYMAGDLSINNLNEIVAKFKEAEKEYDKLEVNVGDVATFDLAVLQLLISLKKTCLRHKKKISFNLDIPKDIMKLLTITGFSNIIKSL